MLKTNKTNEIFPFREVKTPPRLKGNCGTANALVIAGSRVKIQQHTCASSLIVNENCADSKQSRQICVRICFCLHPPFTVSLLFPFRFNFTAMLKGLFVRTEKY